MKKLILLLMIVWGTSLFAEVSTLKEAIQLSKEKDKPIFYFHSATDCSYCKRVAKNIKNSDGIKLMLERDFIYIKVERDLVLVPAYLDTNLTPVFYILGNNGEIIFQQRGYMDQTTLLKFINLSKYKYKNRIK